MVSTVAAVYAQRNKLLRRMGFPSYDAYLRSPLWRRIRAEQHREHPDCYGCGRRGQEVHHANYFQETLTGKSRAGLFTVCETCHKAIEWLAGVKLDPRRATERLKKLRAAWLEGKESASA